MLKMYNVSEAYVAASEVTTLEHELGNDAVEGRALVSETLLAGAESTEVLSSLGDNIVVEDEVDATLLLCEGYMSALSNEECLR
jgi:hypothetical protein